MHDFLVAEFRDHSVEANGMVSARSASGLVSRLTHGVYNATF